MVEAVLSAYNENKIKFLLVDMADQKLENLLNVSLDATNEERQKSPDLAAGYDAQEKTWELIVKYAGSLDPLRDKYPEVKVTELLNQYAVLVAPQPLVEPISMEPAVEFVEKPKRLYFELSAGKAESCIQPLQAGAGNPYRLFGKGTIVAVIDTGINAASSEFRNPDGSTRLLYIWDQVSGEEYDREQIDAALLSGSMIPGRDIAGHGTNVARIACGNYGVAPQSDIIAVKMGVAEPDSFPRTTQLMLAVDYVIRKAVAHNMPVAINISFGNNYGDHTGQSLLESYINDAAGSWKCVFCIGSGNEGLGATHASGRLSDDAEQTVELAISPYETSVNIQIWKDYWDDFEVEIITPSGNNLGRIGRYGQVRRINAGGTTVLAYYGQPSPYSIRQEIYIDLIPSGDYIQQGLWRFRLIPFSIVSGRYDMWLPAISALNEGTGFTSPDSSLTITVPATAQKVVSVGAYDARTRTPAPFSGRGFVAGISATAYVKPDIVAPGVDIRLSETVVVSGTSYATPFACGAAALLMEWGIVKGNDQYLYGEKVRAYLIRGARQLPGFMQYPNNQVGYGALCVRDSIPV